MSSFLSWVSHWLTLLNWYAETHICLHPPPPPPALFINNNTPAVEFKPVHQGSMLGATLTQQLRRHLQTSERDGWAKSGSGESMTRRQVETCVCVFSGKGQSVKAAAADQRVAQRGNSGCFRGFCWLFGVWRLFVWSVCQFSLGHWKVLFWGGII